jgi:general secretion pathway protein D
MNGGLGATGVSGTGSAGQAPNPAAGMGGVGGEYADEGELYRCKNLPKNAKFKVTLKPETDLKDLVNWAMSFTCRNFIFGQGIMGRASKVTIIAPAEMTPGEAWGLFLVSLQTMNLNVVPKGRTLEIVESQSTREKPLPVYKGGNTPNTDQIVRAVFRPDAVSVDDASQVLNSLKSKDGTVTPLPNMGVIIVTDYGSSIIKMAEMMKQLDQPGDGEKIYIIHIRNADASEIGNKLNEILGTRSGGSPQGGAPVQVPQNRGKAPNARTGGAPGMVDATANVTPSKIIADERTNSLIIIASEPAYQRILALVKRLDEPMEGGEGGIHVYYLSNADAEEMSTTLSSVISGQQQRSGGGAQGRAGQPGSVPQQGGAGAFEGSVRVTFDKPTNALVIVSSVKDFLAMREVVRLLDVPRRQVFVEATIMEVSLDKSRKMGLSFHGGVPTEVGGKQSLIVGGVQHGDLGTLALNPASLVGGIAGGFGPTIPESTQILGLAIPSFGVLFQLLQTNNDVNVLSSPHILTTDNVPAEISIGQNIPVASGTGIPNLGGAAGAAGAAGLGLSLGQQVQRQDVGLKLKITPHVNDSDMVRLEIEQEINAIASENFGGLGASWTKRSVKTTIVVKDQEPVVIGGLMEDSVRISESKVPLLGDLPILGYLFKFKKTTKQKTNLLIFLTPYVIKDQADIRRIFDRKMQERKEFMRSYTMFVDPEYEPDIDYGRKKGLIEEINNTVRTADEDEQMLRESEVKQQQREEQGPVEMPAGMGNDNDQGGGQGTTAPPPPPASQPQIQQAQPRRKID